MEHFAKKVTAVQLLIFFTKSFILDISLGSEYASDQAPIWS